MKSTLSQSAKVLVTCLAVAAFFTLSLRAARAQELFVEGSTANSTFNSGTADFDGLIYTAPPRFGGTTVGGIVTFDQPNNNFGTLTFDPSRFVGNTEGSFSLRVLFSSPSGFNILPIVVTGGVVVFHDDGTGDNLSLFFFQNLITTVAFNGPSGFGSFNLQVNDVCIQNGAPCNLGFYKQLKKAWARNPRDFSAQLKEALARRSRDEIARRSGQSGIVNVGWLKPKGAPSLFAPNLLASKFAGGAWNTQSAFTFTFTGSLQILVPPMGGLGTGGCTRGQGFYQANPNVIPDTIVNGLPFGVSLGYRSYTKPELLSIYAMPVIKNGLIALAQQLITAKLNQGAGQAPPRVRQAIIDADALIGDKVVPPVGSDSLAAKQTGALVSLLTQYNDGRIAGAPRCR
jgi:hypothetical protein